ncbi:hypothetical protein [Maricaulis sp.]|uniref:hypothetical protein n=1 Tax=Maricaulis sp. TaxID=1486257 RepID=UPI003A903973
MKRDKPCCTCNQNGHSVPYSLWRAATPPHNMSQGQNLLNLHVFNKTRTYLCNNPQTDESGKFPFAAPSKAG